MKKIIVGLCLCVLLASCQTGIIEMGTDGTKTVLTEKDLEMYSISGSYEDDDLSISISTEYTDLVPYYYTVMIKNNTDTLMSFDPNQCVASAMVGGSIRLVDGETKKINVNLEQAKFPIAPGSYVSRDMYPVNDVDLIFASSVDTIIIPIEKDGKTKFYSVPIEKSYRTETVNVETDIEQVPVGKVSLKKTYWQFLFIGNPQDKIVKDLQEEAKRIYGEDAYLGNIKYEQNWNALSLILYFDLFGYVSTIDATADVYID